MSFARFFSELRKKQNLTNQELAKRFSMSESQIRNICHGRTAIPSHSFFNKLVKYVGGNPDDIAYEIFFGYTDEISHPISDISKSYLSRKYASHHEIIPAVSYSDGQNNEYKFEGIYWKPGYPYNKILLVSFNRNKFYTAIKGTNIIDSLKKLIWAETFFIEKLSDVHQIKEIRYLLDCHNEQDLLIYKELKKVRFVNLGKNCDISFVLFDTYAKNKTAEKQKLYVTERRTTYDI